MTTIDLYTLPHKAIRVAVNAAGQAVSAADAPSFDATTAVVASVLDELRAHADHEETFIHPLLRRFAPEIETELDDEHRALELAIDELDAAFTLAGARRELDPSHLIQLHRSFQRFTAANLVHLDREETVAMPTLWATVPADVLAEVMPAFRAAHPEAGELYRRWPAGLTRHERHLVGV